MIPCKPRRPTPHAETLQIVNKELLKTLRKCVELLELFKPVVDDPVGWQEMLDTVHQTIEVAEMSVEAKILH